MSFRRGRPLHRPSVRERMATNKRSHEFYSALSDQPVPAEFARELPPKRVQRPAGSAGGPPLEREVLKAVWKLLAHHPKVKWVTRLNSGTAMADFGEGGIAPIRFNYKPGMSDLIGQMKDGRFLACEVKREGAPVKPHQQAFLDEVREAHGVSFVARSIDDALREMNNA